MPTSQSDINITISKLKMNRDPRIYITWILANGLTSENNEPVIIPISHFRLIERFNWFVIHETVQNVLTIRPMLEDNEQSSDSDSRLIALFEIKSSLL